MWNKQRDCSDYQATLRRHATQLTAAGVDHVVVVRGLSLPILSAYHYQPSKEYTLQY